MIEQKPTITIGLPVYNGEKFLKKRLENILSQTYSNFELIISDNDSTDDTSKICNEFLKNDKRIKYFLQNTNIGGILNYTFVLNKAITKYFVFATADDLWSSNFLSENIEILNENSSVVGSIGKIEWIDNDLKLKKKVNTTSFHNFYKKIQSLYGRYGSFSIMDETYEKRTIKYLKKLIRHDPSNILYSVFRTESLQKSISPKIHVDEFYSSFWNNVCLNVLEYGTICLSNNNQIYYYAGGSGAGVTPITQYKKGQITLLQCIFPWSSQISWCIHKFGFKFFSKYFIVFLKLFLQGELTFIYSLYKYIKK